MRNTHFRPGLWLENSKKCKMRHKHCLAWNMARNTQKRVHCGPGIWQKNWKIKYNGNSHNRTGNKARNIEKGRK